MTLLPRLAQQTGACVLLSWCERLPQGRFKVHIEPWTGDSLNNPNASAVELATRMNEAVEKLVRAHPEQYLWAYERHKQPRKGD